MPLSFIVVEDHVMFRQLFASFIAAQPGWKLAGEAATAAEGAALCLRHRPALAVVDWMLPDLSGIEVVRRVGIHSPDTRFLMLSSRESGENVQQAIDAGVHGFVLKRQPVDLLLSAIDRVARGETFYCPASSELLVQVLRAQAAGDARMLSPREREILRLIAEGEPPKAIADRLHLSIKTVNNHVGAIRDKLGIRETAGLIRYAIKHRLVETP